MPNQIPPIELHFPVGGLHRRYARQKQPPYTTPDCLNVRAFDPLEGRERGGSRPGLTKAYTNIIGDISVTGTTSGTGTAITASESLVKPTAAVAECDGKVVTFATSGETYTISSVVASTSFYVAGDASGETFDDGYSIACSDIDTLSTISYLGAGIGKTLIGCDEEIFALWMVGQKVEFGTSGNQYTITDYVNPTGIMISGDHESEGDSATTVQCVSVETCDGIPIYGGANGRTEVTATASKFTTAHIGQSFVFDTSGVGYKIADYLDHDGKRITVEGDATGEASGDTFTISIGSPIRLLETVVPVVLGTTGLLVDGFEYAVRTPDESGPGDPLHSEWHNLTGSTHAPTVLKCEVGEEARGFATNFGRVAGYDVWTYRDVIGDLDTSEDYVISVLCSTAGQSTDVFKLYNHGTFYLFARMNNTTPDPAGDGVIVSWTIGGMYGLVTITASQANQTTATELATAEYETGGVAPILVSLSVDSSDNLIVSINRNPVITTSATLHGNADDTFGFGFDLSATPTGSHQYIDTFKVAYTSTVSGERPEARLVASAYGDLHAEDDAGQMPQVTSELSLRSDVMLQAAQRAGKLFIADWGDVLAEGTDGVNGAGAVTFDSATYADWTALSIDDDDDVLVIWDAVGSGTAVEDGVYRIADSGVAAAQITTHASQGIASAQDATACDFKILRGPKVYDPDAGTLALWLQEDDGSGTPKGIIPTGCPLIALYLDRMFLAGNPEHVWYASRIGNPYDWNYGASLRDPSRAIAGTASDAGVLPDPLKAMFSASGVFLIFACENSLWAMRGDPGLGAPIVNMSHSIGIIDKAAWCHSPVGDVYFLSRDGLYVLPAGASVFPAPLSREKLPQELLNIDTSLCTVVLSYDLNRRDVHIYITPNTAGGGQHWLFNLQSQSFWPVTLPDSQESFAATTHSLIGMGSRMSMLGSRDGRIRHYSDDSPTDDGISIASHVVYGPFRLSSVADGEGILTELAATLDAASGDVTWSLHIGDTPEEALAASAFDSGTWDAGENYKSSPRARAQYLALKVVNGNSRAWAIENIIARIKPAGKQRLF